MSNAINTPEIRFEGYTDAWEQRKLGDVFTQTVEYVNPKSENIELWSLTVEKGLTPKTDRYIRDFLVFKEDKYKEVSPNDVVYNPMNMTLGAIGYNDMPITVAVSGYYVTMKPSNNIDGYYIVTWMQLAQSIELYKAHATGSLLEKQRVQYPTFSGIKFTIPSLGEQHKIGAYFKNLDNLITLHQRKLFKLKNLKKAMIEKMFPKDGSNIPELRFVGFTDAWEQRKLEDFYQRAYSGGTPAATNEEFYGGDIPFMGISDIKHRYITKAGKSITEQGLLSSTARMVPKGAITLAMYASVGKVGITMIEVATSQAFFNLIFEFDETRDFVYTRLEKAELEKEWEQLISTGTQRNLNAQKIKEWLISFPGLKEQARIGDYFRHLDDHITLHQRKLDKVKNIKKSLLGKMFV